VWEREQNIQSALTQLKHSAVTLKLISYKKNLMKTLPEQATQFLHLAPAEQVRQLEDQRPMNMLTTAFRAARLILHILYGMLQVIFLPYLDISRQKRMTRLWSLQLLGILNIGIRTEGRRPVHGAGGCLMVANHISWIDIFVLNAIHPSRFIAKAQVRDWPVIGWLSRRSNTIFIKRDMRHDVASVNLQVGALLKNGVCVGLFPEGTSTDGRQVGHFHSALLQPAIDAGASLLPVALRYLDETDEPAYVAAFIGDTTLLQSIWRILRCRHLDALVVFTPAVAAAGENRRVLARAAQQSIAHALQNTYRQSMQRCAQHDGCYPLLTGLPAAKSP
jgi:1-acyl-sn-glycerol-3-phosphate acyltransferase